MITSSKTVFTTMASLLIIVLLSACQSVKEQSEKTPHGDIDLYVERALEPWNLYISTHDSKQTVGGPLATLAAQSGNIRIETSGKSTEDDALTLTWSDAWLAKLGMEGGEPLDLSEHLASGGVVSFDLLVEDLEKGDIALMLSCGENCTRQVDFSTWARTLANKGWQESSVPLSCLARESDDFSRITEPFSLRVGGNGKVSIADIRITQSGSGTVPCVAYDILSVAPGPLTASWALDWWVPRHQEKLARVQQGGVDLLMIGDSITHGWENAGKDLWAQYYAPRNAVNLGYSGDRTENVLWRLEQGEADGISPKVAVLMIGTNNAGHRQEAPAITAKGISKIVDELKARLPETKILLLGIFPRGETADDQLRRINHKTNAEIEKLAADERVTYLNINKQFLDSDGNLSKDIMPDLLHPNHRGYEIWAEAMEPVLAELLEE